MEKTLTLGFSPCPNDTFIFDALIHGKIDTEGLRFEAVLEDVETLNEWAFRDKLDITKLSFRALLDVLPGYRVLNAGSALGNGCGPLLIGRPDSPSDPAQIASAVIAIPGINTTANMLLSFAFPEAGNRVPMLFSEIEQAVLERKADLGLIIHESRFTYRQKGLVKIMDLGEYWEKQTGCPIPLGGIAIRRDLPHTLQQQVDRLIRQSVEYAFRRYPELAPFVRENAQEMEEDVMRQHIDLYVNDYTLDLGEKGRRAIYAMNAHLPGQAARRLQEANLFV
ncbi:1,4-dihydroxy-6-naphthoate synthase [Compostibacter hankyongensis]